MDTAVKHNSLAFVFEQDTGATDFTARAKRGNLHDGVVNHRTSGEGISSRALHEEDWPRKGFKPKARSPTRSFYGFAVQVDYIQIMS